MPIVSIEGDDGSVNEVEVPHDAIEVQEDEDLVYKTQESFDDTLNTRLSRKERNLRSELKESQEFWEEMAAERGIELRDDGRPKGSLRDEEIQELKQKASKVDALEEQVSEYESTIQETREKGLKQDLLEKAPPAANETAEQTFIREAKSQMTYDEEYGWVAVDEDGGVAYDAGEPVGPDQVIESLKDSHGFLFEDTSMEGGPEDDPTASSGSTMTRSQYREEVKQARQEDDLERMEELEEMEAADQIVSD